jgi:hypothetical protein
VTPRPGLRRLCSRALTCPDALSGVSLSGAWIGAAADHGAKLSSTATVLPEAAAAIFGAGPHLTAVFVADRIRRRGSLHAAYGSADQCDVVKCTGIPTPNNACASCGVSDLAYVAVTCEPIR